MLSPRRVVVPTRRREGRVTGRVAGTGLVDVNAVWPRLKAFYGHRDSYRTAWSFKEKGGTDLLVIGIA